MINIVYIVQTIISQFNSHTQLFNAKSVIVALPVMSESCMQYNYIL